MSGAASRQLRRWAQEAGVRRVKKFKNVPTYKKWKIVRGDKVQVISGQYKGDQGTVLAVHRKQNMVTVDNTKLIRKAVKGTETSPGGITTFPGKFHVSKVSLVDPASGKPTRVQWKVVDGKKVRVATKSQVIIPRPDDVLTERRSIRRVDVADNDTTEAEATKATWTPPDYSNYWMVDVEEAEATVPPPPSS